MSDLWESCEWHDHPEFLCSSATGPTARGDFVRIMGVREPSAQRTLSQLVKDGLLLVSDGPKSPVRIGFPMDALNIHFPNLYPEAATVDAASVSNVVASASTEPDVRLKHQASFSTSPQAQD